MGWSIMEGRLGAPHRYPDFAVSPYAVVSPRSARPFGRSTINKQERCQGYCFSTEGKSDLSLGLQSCCRRPIWECCAALALSGLGHTIRVELVWRRPAELVC